MKHPALLCTGSCGAIAVKYSDPGIGDENVADIVLPFRKARASGEGGGLALAIVRQAADLHGGRLGVRRSTSGDARFELVPQCCAPRDSSPRGWPS